MRLPKTQSRLVAMLLGYLTAVVVGLTIHHTCNVTNGWVQFGVGALLGILFTDITLRLFYEEPE